MLTKTQIDDTVDPEPSPFSIISNLLDFDNLDYGELTGKELGLLYIAAIREENEIAKKKISDEVFDSL